MRKLPRTYLLITLLLVNGLVCAIGSTTGPGLLSDISITSFGAVISKQQVNITANADVIIGTNNLSLGFSLGSCWKSWYNDSTSIELSRNASFKLVRLVDVLFEPCSYWNETARNGMFNWTGIDAILKIVFSIGAEPLITIGFYSWETNSMLVPQGMANNPVTRLPYPTSFGAYAAEWAKHFKSAGFPVRYYEIVNEPHHYFGWNGSNATRLGYYAELWNTAARMMRNVNSQILLSQDSITQQNVLDYWLQYGDDIDYLDFHKYDSDSVGQYNDSELFNRAETLFFENTPTIYGVREAQQRWLDTRGTFLPVINVESNLNSAYTTGTDPRIQQIAGAVWTALVLRKAIVKGLSFNVYNTFSSSASLALLQSTSEGLGFGMINSDDNQPYYPYCIQKLIGMNLDINDLLFLAESSSSDVPVLGWYNKGEVNLLVISKTNEPRTVILKGLRGQMSFSKIQNSTLAENPIVQEGQIDAGSIIALDGYAVMLLRTINRTLDASTVFKDGFESGSCNAWNGSGTSTNETANVVNTYTSKFTSNGDGGNEMAYCYEIISSSSELYSRGYFRVETSGITDNDDRFYFLIFEAGNNPVAFAGWRKVSGVVKWNLIIRNGTGWANAYSTTSPSVNQWYCVEMHWKKDAANGIGELWIDGTKICFISGRNTAYHGNVDCVDFGLVETMNCGATTVYGDFAKISNAYIGLEPTQVQATIFDDSFGSGSFVMWTGTHVSAGETAAVVSALKHHGSYSAKFMSNGNGGTEWAYCYETINSSTELFARGYFRVETSGITDNDDRFYFLIFEAGNNPVAFAGWRKVSGVVKWNLIIRNGTGWANAYSTTSPSVNQWYCVEMHWKKDAANGIGELYVNGAVVCSIFGKNTAYYGNMNRVEFGLPEIVSCGTATVYGDCAKIATTYIGPEP